MQRTDDSHKVLRRVLLAVTLLLGILSCTMRRSDVPVNSWWSSRGPVVPHDTFPADCTLCHKGGDWHTLREDFQYDHAQETGYALEGAHAAAECLRCHNDRGPVAAFVSRGCAGCHEDIHQGMAGDECTTCHAENDWRPKPEIASHSRTRFSLVGAHAATACWRCHPGAQVGRFDHADPECIACHASDLSRASNPANPTTPNHMTQGWTSGCDRCHIPTSWDGAGFNHAGFSLTGQHATTPCAQCHVGGNYAGTPQDCYACHAADYNGATSLNHVALGISTQCQLCHTTSTWQGANFNHVGITNGCLNCHQSDYNGTSNPPHASAGFPTNCESCHDTIDWDHGTFQHAFPITSGKHRNFPCADCHTTPNNYQLFSCIDCHEHNQSNTAGHHSGNPNYQWNTPACYNCHPQGN